MRPLHRSIVLLALTVGAAEAASAQGSASYPAKGVARIGTGPLPLLVHYLEKSGKKVQVTLRDLSFAAPDLRKSKELAALARRQCGAGDMVEIRNSRIPAEATGADAVGIGRFVWLVTGRFSTDGKKWWFEGTITAKDDLYDFNKGKDGERALWAEVSTRLGAAFDGKQFWIQITGTLPVNITGTCTQSSAGQSIV